MSHWKNIEIDIECSIEVLRRILINIMPKWESFLKNPSCYDPNGGLTAKSSYQAAVNGCSIVVPMGSETGVHGADIGFIQTSKNKWKMRYDYKPHAAADIENRIKQEYAVLHTQLEAQAKSLQIIEDEVDGNDHFIRILVPSDYVPGQFEA